jgi:hypothetical protein
MQILRGSCSDCELDYVPEPGMVQIVNPLIHCPENGPGIAATGFTGTSIAKWTRKRHGLNALFRAIYFPLVRDNVSPGITSGLRPRPVEPAATAPVP